ncbi:hypothetical protein [Streptomyces sp. 8K308]|uniref:hypothetical protein n=1 Tax=Streptomyces sp. 8K308 TaxID=2530388 RepID=UPI001A9FCADF|nr:hypothetical protein [Streptomyces sp. 8K308]
MVVEEHRPAGGVAEALALLLPDHAVTGVNAGHLWPAEGGDHAEVLGQLGLTLSAVLTAAA